MSYQQRKFRDYYPRYKQFRKQTNFVLPRKIARSVINGYRKLYVESYYQRRYVGLHDICQELYLAPEAVIYLTSSDGVYPEFDFILSKFERFYKDYFIFKLVVDSYKYVRDFKHFGGLETVNVSIVNRKMIREFWDDNYEEYRKEFANYVF